MEDKKLYVFVGEDFFDDTDVDGYAGVAEIDVFECPEVDPYDEEEVEALDYGEGDDCEYVGKVMVGWKEEGDEEPQPYKITDDPTGALARAGGVDSIEVLWPSL